MKHTTRLIISAAMAAATAAGLSSCQHKELCYDHAHVAPVQVVFDWSQAPDATPSFMDVYFYPHDGGEAQRFALDAIDGGTVELLYCSYDVIFLGMESTGTTANLRRGTASWSSFEVYTRNASVLEGMGMVTASAEPPKAEGAENESGALSPDPFWSGRAQKITVTAAPEQKLILTPEQSFTRISVEISGAENLKYVSAVSGSLSGLSRGYTIGPDRLDTECVCVPFAIQSDGESRLEGMFTSFGHCPDGNDGTPHKLVIYAILGDESKWYYEYDVTEQVHDAPDQKDIHIILDGLPLPKPITNGSGMQPSVDDWDNIQVDIEM